MKNIPAIRLIRLQWDVRNFYKLFVVGKAMGIYMNENSLTHGIKTKDKLGYALGDTAGLLTFGLISSFLQMFYTDTLKIDPAKIAILFLIARIWNAINNPMWGAFIDSRKPTKHGRFRPYILGASIPLAIPQSLCLPIFHLS